MTDDRWTSPGGTAPSAVPPIEPAASAPPPSFPPSYAGQPGFSGQQGWTPPPKPGLIPLRPLDLGTILGASFRVLRRNPKPTFGAALLIQGSVYLLLAVIVGLVTVGALSRIDSTTAQNADQVTAGAYGLIVVAAVIPGLLAVIASAVLQGIIVLEVSRGAVGEKLTLGALLRRARGRIGALIGWAALVLLASTIVLGVIVGVIVLLAATLGVGGVIAAVLLGIFGFLGIVVLYAWLGTKLSLVPSVLMIERSSLRDAIARSWSLTRSFFWRTFGITLLVSVIVGFVSQIVSIPFNIFLPLVAGLLDPQGQNQAPALIATVAISAFSVIVLVVVVSITAVVQSATTGLIYLDLRIRKEGLDLELIHYVEARQAGQSDVADPLLHAAPLAPATASEPSGSQWG